MEKKMKEEKLTRNRPGPTERSCERRKSLEKGYGGWAWRYGVQFVVSSPINPGGKLGILKLGQEGAFSCSQRF